MSENVGDFIVARLQDWGVRRIYGYPGDGINGITAGIRRTEGAVDFVQVRDEETAAFCACAHAKYSGELGVCDRGRRAPRVGVLSVSRGAEAPEGLGQVPT